MPIHSIKSTNLDPGLKAVETISRFFREDVDGSEVSRVVFRAAMIDSSPSPVLVVEDNSDNLLLISLTVQDFGYHVVTARDGEEALSIAELTLPRLILMDIAMPKMDGLDATRRLRTDPKFLKVPIIALTAFETDGFQHAAAEVGFDGYLTKPIDFERLRRLMNALLSAQSPSHPVYQSTSFPTRQTGPLEERFMLWRKFCAENALAVEASPDDLSPALRERWEFLKNNPTYFFEF